jgi:hypothetical protein
LSSSIGRCTSEADLSPLLRGDLDTVSIVRDYVEVRIPYNVLRCMTAPIVRTESGDCRFPEPGSRDALCSLIDSSVTRVQVKDGDAIELDMDSGETLVFPLDEDSRTLPDGRVLPEAVHLVPADTRGRLDGAKMVIW